MVTYKKCNILMLCQNYILNIPKDEKIYRINISEKIAREMKIPKLLYVE
jgi:hypothetical protein